MGINDYGSVTDPLSSPSLSDWAESVAQVLDGSDVSVDARLTAWSPTGDLDMADNDILNAGFVYASNISAITSRADNLDAGFNDVIAALKPITIPLAPVADMEVANKKYVDDNGGGGVGGTSGIYRVVLGAGGTDSDWTYLGSPVTGRPADMPAWGIIQFDTAQHEDVAEPTQFMWDHGEAGDQWMRWQTVLFPTP